MKNPANNPRLVGSYLRERREALGLSQRELGLLFNPKVTTQFISNVERGVTPLPPTHVPTLAQALRIPETELLSLLEREYTAKLSGRLGRPALNGSADGAGGNSHQPVLTVSDGDFDFIRRLYDAYSQADPKTRQAFHTVCESLLSLAKPR